MKLHHDTITSLIDDTRISNGRSKLVSQILSKSLFNDAWYLLQLPCNDLKTLIPEEHYHQFGWRLGLDPHPLFSTTWYIEKCTDVRESGQNPLKHYLNCGIHENRSPHPLIDVEYLSESILSDEEETPTFIKYLSGLWLDHNPHPLFNTEVFYSTSNLQKDCEPVLQYILQENKTNIITHPLFDREYICSREAGVNPDDDLLISFIRTEESNLLRTSKYFDPKFYLHSNPDVKDRGTPPLLHYIVSGRDEDREPYDRYRLVYKEMLEKLYTQSTSLDPLSYAISEGIDPILLKNLLSRLSRFFESLIHTGNQVGFEKCIELVENRRREIERECPRISVLSFISDMWNIMKSFLFFSSGNIHKASNHIKRLPDELDSSLTNGLVLKKLSGHGNENYRHFNLIKKKNLPLPRKEKVVVYTSLFGEYDQLAPILTHQSDIDFVCFTDQAISPKGWNVKKVKRTTPDNNLEAKRFKVFPWEQLKGYDYSLFVDANTILYGNIDSLLNGYLLGEPFACWAHPERSNLVMECFAIFLQGKHPKQQTFKQLAAYLNKGSPVELGMVEASFIWRSHSSKEVQQLMKEWWSHILKFSTRDQPSLTYLMHMLNIRPRIFPVNLGTARSNPWLVKKPHLDQGHNRNKSKPTDISGSRKCVFLYDNAHLTSGTTVMRCFQAASIIKTHHPKIDVSVSNNCDLKDSIMILSKGVIKRISMENLEKLKTNGNILLADPVDDPLNHEKLEFFDGIIAASISAYLAYTCNHSNIPIFHLTHAIDIRLPSPVPVEGLKIGYFGETVNTISSHKIDEHVDIIQINTKTSSTDWLSKITNYNCHYAVRKKRKIDDYKPFLKGFTAAHFSSPVIIDKGNREAEYYLGPDYPFVIKTTKEDDILNCIDLVRSCYGSSLWDEAKYRMQYMKKRSSVEWFASEFSEILKYFS